MTPSGPATSKPIVWANFNYSPLSPKINQGIQFTDKSFGYPPLTTLIWNFGDSTITSEKNPNHPYENIGTYNVVLTVGNSPNNISSQTLVVEIIQNISPGIHLQIIETQPGSNQIKYVGYKYIVLENNLSDIRIQYTPVLINEETNEKTVHISEFENPVDYNSSGSELIIDFDNELLFFDEEYHLIGHIEYEYEYRYQKQFPRHAIVFFHNDDPICDNEEDNSPPFFPYGPGKANYDPSWEYFCEGEYPVSMLIPPGNETPQEYNKIPLLFVHGIFGSYCFEEKSGANPNSTSRDEVSYWHNTYWHFNDNYKDIFHSWQYYYPYDMDLEHISMCIDTAIGFLHNNLYPGIENKIRIVAHSMGGPVLLTYLKNNPINASINVAKILFLASPVNGSLMGDRGYAHGTGEWAEFLSSIFTSSDIDNDNPALRDLSLSSNFNYNLHFSQNNSIRTLPLLNYDQVEENYFSIGFTTCNEHKSCAWPANKIHVESPGHSDGAVSISSASLLNHGVPLATIHGNHDDAKWSKPNLESDTIISDIIFSYFTHSYSDFLNELQFNENFEKEVRTIILPDRTVLKPSTSPPTTLNNLNTDVLTSTNEEDVNYQKGIINLIMEILTDDVNSVSAYYNTDISTLLLPLWDYYDYESQGYTKIGSFVRNSYNKTDNIECDYDDKIFFFNGNDENKGCAINFKNQDLHHIAMFSLIHEAVTCDFYPKYCETQTIIFPAAKETNPSNNWTDVKSINSEPIHLHNYDSVRTFFIDSLASKLVLYYTNLTNSEISLNYNIHVIKPDGSQLDNNCATCINYSDTLLGSKTIEIQDPEIGIWKTWIESDELLLQNTPFQIQAALLSKITPRIIQDSTSIDLNTNMLIQLSLVLDSLDLLDSVIVKAEIKMLDGPSVSINLDSVLQTNDTTIVFSASFPVNNPGYYTVKFNSSGKYGSYWFERMNLEQFKAIETTPKIRIPDISLHQGKEFISIDLIDKLYYIDKTSESINFDFDVLFSSLDSNEIGYNIVDSSYLLNFYSAISDTGTLVLRINANINNSIFLIDTFNVNVVMPDINLTSLMTDSLHIPGSNFCTSYWIANNGNSASFDTEVKYYLSEDTNYDSTDVCIYTKYLPYMNFGYSLFCQDTFHLPELIRSGEYYLLLVADKDNFIKETTKSNNIAFKHIIILPWVTLSDFLPMCNYDLPLILTGGNPSGGIYNGPGVVNGIFNPILTGPGEFEIEYVYTDINGYSSSKIKTISVFPSPEIYLGSDTTLIYNTSLLINISQNNATYIWSDGSTFPMRNIDTSGTFWATITDTLGCSNSDTINVIVYPQPFDINIQGQSICCPGELLSLSLQLNYGIAPFQYSWSPNPYINDTTSDSPTINPFLTSTFFVSVTDSRGQNASDSITIYITSGGWEPQASGFATLNRGISSISAVNENIAWGTAFDGTFTNEIIEVTKTENGGQTWNSVTVNDYPGYGPSMIFALNDNKAWIPIYGPNGNGKILKTIDGGQTWNPTPPDMFSGPNGYPNVVYFWDSENGICIGDPNGASFEIYTTTDGGTNWTIVPSAYIPIPLENETGVSDFYSVKGDTVFFGTSKLRIFRSVDKGLNWEAFNTPVMGLQYHFLRSIGFKNHLEGFVSVIYNSGGVTKFLKTNNGGDSWQLLTSTGNRYFYDVGFVPGTEGTLIGTGSACSSIYFCGAAYSHDWGQSWSLFEDYEGIQMQANDFVGPNCGWAGGYNSSPTSGGLFKFTGFCNPPQSKTITVRSENPDNGVSILVSPPDNTGQSSGLTEFSRSYNINTTVSLHAPGSIGNQNFVHWKKNSLIHSTDSAINLTVADNDTLTAVYQVCQLPAIQSITGGGTYCYGGTGVNVGVNSTQVGATYQLKINGVASGLPKAGTGLAISWGTQTIEGIYTVEASNSCGSVNMNGSVAVEVDTCNTISGVLKVDNTSGTPMDNSQVLLKQNDVVVMQTGTSQDGSYLLSNVPNGNYLLTATSAKDWCVANSYDAYLIQKDFIGMPPPLTGLRKQVADVSCNGFSNSYDALLVQKRFVGMIESFACGNWGFESINISMNNANITQEIKALSMGDVNGSCAPQVKLENSVSLSYYSSVDIIDGKLTLPVRAGSQLRFNAIDLALDFTDNCFEVTGVDTKHSGSLVYHISGNRLLISWYNIDPVIVASGEDIFNITLLISDPVKCKYPFSLGDESRFFEGNGNQLSNVLINTPVLNYESPDFWVRQNVPNPFNGITEVTFSLPQQAYVSVYISNILGETIKTLSAGLQREGQHTISVDLQGFSPGVYYYTLVASGNQRNDRQTRKLVISLKE
ncbi:MAG: PKD domain-containing protein [Bacteroidales bacterium]